MALKDWVRHYKYGYRPVWVSTSKNKFRELSVVSSAWSQHTLVNGIDLDLDRNSDSVYLKIGLDRSKLIKRFTDTKNGEAKALKFAKQYMRSH